MSSTVNLGLVAEGVTDYELIRSAVESMLGDRSFDMKLLQPEGSVAFGTGNAGPLGGGWRGVYRWCAQSADRAEGKLSNDPLFLRYDLLIVHLDADVACEDPARDPVNPIAELDGVLPCEKPCPPPSDTTDELRRIMLDWLGEPESPKNTILCTPSKNTEAWVVGMLFPTDSQLLKLEWECYSSPETRLSQQPKAQRISKDRMSYQGKAAEFSKRWAVIVAELSEAKRFNDEFVKATGFLAEGV